jgi:hypothetical protein
VALHLLRHHDETFPAVGGFKNLYRQDLRREVNGVDRSFDGDPEMPLLWYLCDELNLTGTLIVQDP